MITLSISPVQYLASREQIVNLASEFEGKPLETIGPEADEAIDFGFDVQSHADQFLFVLESTYRRKDQ